MSEEEKFELSRRSFGKLCLLISALSAAALACKTGLLGEENPTPTEAPKPVSPVAEQEHWETSHLIQAEIQLDEGLIQAILRAWSQESGEPVTLDDFGNLGVIWMKGAKIYAHIKDKFALEALGIMDNLGGTQVNEVVLSGKVRPVQDCVDNHPNYQSSKDVKQIIVVESERVLVGEGKDQKEILLVNLYNGPFLKRITFFLEMNPKNPEQATWQAQIGETTYTDLNQALIDSQKPDQE